MINPVKCTCWTSEYPATECPIHGRSNPSQCDESLAAGQGTHDDAGLSSGPPGNAAQREGQCAGGQIPASQCDESEVMPNSNRNHAERQDNTQPSEDSAKPLAANCDEVIERLRNQSGYFPELKDLHNSAAALIAELRDDNRDHETTRLALKDDVAFYWKAAQEAQADLRYHRKLNIDEIAKLRDEIELLHVKRGTDQHLMVSIGNDLLKERDAEIAKLQDERDWWEQTAKQLERAIEITPSGQEIARLKAAWARELLQAEFMHWSCTYEEEASVPATYFKEWCRERGIEIEEKP